MAYSKPTYKPRYENFIGGEWVPPLSGEYFDNLSPVDGELLTKIPRSTPADVDAAVAAGVKRTSTLRSSSEVHSLTKSLIKSKRI